MSDIRKLLGPVRKLHETIRAVVVEACEQATLGEMARVVRSVVMFDVWSGFRE